jgi:transposase
LTRSSQAAAGLAQRARIVLLAAEGTPNARIGRQVGVPTPTVLPWRNRYDAGGIDALADLERSGRPAMVDEVAIVVRTVSDDGRPPAHLGMTHWSARLLADQLRREGTPVSFATVSRVWRK